MELPLQSVEGTPKTAGDLQTRAALDEANARSAAAMDAFDRSIAKRARRAVSSICEGCRSGAGRLAHRTRSMEANALREERFVDDPALARLE